MRFLALSLFAVFSLPTFADNQQINKDIAQLKAEARSMEAKLYKLQKDIAKAERKAFPKKNDKSSANSSKQQNTQYHDSAVRVHQFNRHPESFDFYPTALIADDHVVTYIAGTPVVSSPYLGDRPAFDGSDYIVNISSINRDIRLMQQRRRLYDAYTRMGYPVPNMPIISLSGAIEPSAVLNSNNRYKTGDFNLGTSELDIAAALNENVEAFMAIAYDSAPPAVGGPRVNNSAFNLKMGFINIGNLNKTPFYFTAGQVYIPFGRYSSAMIDSPLTLELARTKARPFILGYKSQDSKGLFASVYGFRGETRLGRSGVGGANLGYVFGGENFSGEIGGSYITSMNDSAGMQNTGSVPFTTFGGFSSLSNGSELVRKTPAADFHANISFDRYSLTAEWVGSTTAFRPQDLSFNGRGARPSAAQIEAGVTFIMFNRPSSIGLGYQYSREALALNLPKQRINAVYNISIWKDTVESIGYQHDIHYKIGDYANGAAPLGTVNLPTLGMGDTSDLFMAQIGVYF